jgi:hypothetical protein
MKKIRPFLLGVFATLAASVVGTVGASSASAATCLKEPTSGNFALCIEATLGSETLLLIERTVGFLDFKETKTPLIFETPSLNEKMECFRAQSTGTIVPSAKNVTVAGLTISFETGCHIVGVEAVCKVTEPITTTPIVGTITLIGGSPDILFKPESGTLLWAMHLTGEECEAKGTTTVTGEQLCESPALEEDSIEQLIECSLSGSELKVGTKEFKLELDELIDLHPPFEGDKWSIIQGK